MANIIINNPHGEVLLDATSNPIFTQVAPTVLRTGSTVKSVDEFTHINVWRDPASRANYNRYIELVNPPVIKPNNKGYFTLYNLEDNVPVAITNYLSTNAIPIPIYTGVGNEFNKVVGKVLKVDIEAIKPVAGNYLNVYKDNGEVAWSLQSMSQMPMYLARHTLRADVGMRPSNMDFKYFDIPDWCDLSKVWFRVNGDPFYLIFGNDPETSYFVDFTLKRVGRRLYVLSQWYYTFNFSMESQVKDNWAYTGDPNSPIDNNPIDWNIEMYYLNV